MLDGIALDEMKYEDIEALTASKEPESVSLDYKREVSGSNPDKSELAKDVAAMANSQGGHIIIGVAEDKGKPVHPPCGTPSLIGRQKIEEWIEQTVNHNIAQRVELGIRSVELPGTDRRLVVLRAPISPRMPHMVTFNQDNRYYRRIFKRHGFQSLPAEEYEVREMFEKSTRLRSKVLEYLADQGYANPNDKGFGTNLFTDRLGMQQRTHHTQTEIVKATSFVTFVVFPDLMETALLPVSGETMWKWLEPNARRYPPALRALFLPTQKRMILDGILLTERYSTGEEGLRGLEKFLRIQRNGFVEMGWSLASKYDEDLLFPFCAIMGIFHMFLKFVEQLYGTFAPDAHLTLAVNMVGTGDALLHNLGKG
jgi:hypothetical protein